MIYYLCYVSIKKLGDRNRLREAKKEESTRHVVRRELRMEGKKKSDEVEVPRKSMLFVFLKKAINCIRKSSA